MATKRYNFKFHCAKDADIIARLDQQDNMQDYIRLLIKSDILADSINLTLATPDQEQARQDYYNSHCKDMVFSGDHCCDSTCAHFKVDDHNCHFCTIEEDFAKYWEGVMNNACKN